MAGFSVSMPFRGEGGKLPASADELESVKASLLRILHTRRGERLMRPEIGSRCWDLVYENLGPLMGARLRAEVVSAIGAQEPRVKVLAVDVQQDAVRSEVSITITYRLGSSVATLETSLGGGFE